MLNELLLLLLDGESAPAEPEPQKAGGAPRRRPAWIIPPRPVAVDLLDDRRRRNQAVLFAVILP